MIWLICSNQYSITVPEAFLESPATGFGALAPSGPRSPDLDILLEKGFLAGKFRALWKYFTLLKSDMGSATPAKGPLPYLPKQ